ncbi:hypothetical protein IWQ61_007127 [Dispira simplex]|nr:hypothetical protein IWQ61_007127 [Dispira simplex]
MYTLPSFFCAINPDKRPAWGKKMNELLSDSGVLVTLMFPIKKFTDDTPPYLSTPEDYEKVLNPYFKLVEKCEPKTSVMARKGLEMFGIWRKKDAVN